MSIFKFKQFEVDQTGCAMKINTDGVLLGAMVGHQSPMRILDIGTGTGVIALMLAQRFPEAFIQAVEIDEKAAETAGRNFGASVFNERLKVQHVAIEDFNSDEKFDLIVSNPPFFVNDLKNQEARKGIARHAGEQFFYDLIIKVNELLSATGIFWFVLPVKQAEQLISSGIQYGLYLNQQIDLHSDETKPAFRNIVGLSRSKVALERVRFNIYQAEKVYTQTYQNLLKPYFLGY
ncbi:tRNA methyltransferase [Pedobacter sp. KBW01]|nr:tRNA methyltransferase [Pedobacter sp. KBW01]